MLNLRSQWAWIQFRKFYDLVTYCLLATDELIISPLISYLFSLSSPLLLYSSLSYLSPLLLPSPPHRPKNQATVFLSPLSKSSWHLQPKISLALLVSEKLRITSPCLFSPNPTSISPNPYLPRTGKSSSTNSEIVVSWLVAIWKVLTHRFPTHLFLTQHSPLPNSPLISS